MSGADWLIGFYVSVGIGLIFIGPFTCMGRMRRIGLHKFANREAESISMAACGSTSLVASFVLMDAFSPEAMVIPLVVGLILTATFIPYQVEKARKKISIQKSGGSFTGREKSQCAFYSDEKWLLGTIVLNEKGFSFTVKGVRFSYPFKDIGNVLLDSNVNQFKIILNDGQEFLFQNKNALDFVNLINSAIDKTPEVNDQESNANAAPISADNGLGQSSGSGIMFICQNCRFQVRAEQPPKVCPECFHLFKYDNPVKDEGKG